jgi:prepilin-type N-terminal cleavage/methylation domain-containing protein
MSKKTCGFSLIELLLVITLLSLMAGLIFTFLNLTNIVGRQRDALRLSDLSTMVVAIESYIADHAVPPDSADVTRRSDQAGFGSYPSNADGTGWIVADLRPYIGQLRIDPLNKNLNGIDFFYRYRHDGRRYKLDTILEAEKRLMENSIDGGIDNNYYEVGTGKDIEM